MTVVGLAAGAAGILLAERLLEDLDVLSLHAPGEAISRTARTLRLLTGLIGLSTVAFGGYFMALSVRAMKHMQFPPPGARVISDTVVVRGDTARKRGLIGVVMSALLITGGLGIWIIGWMLVASLTSSSFDVVP